MVPGSYRMATDDRESVNYVALVILKDSSQPFGMLMWSRPRQLRRAPGPGTGCDRRLRGDRERPAGARCARGTSPMPR